MDKLTQLLERCKCGAYLTINQHRDYYETAAVRLYEYYDFMECTPDVSDEVRAEMIKRDTIIDLQFYPDTPVGSYQILHFDLEAALDEALACVGLATPPGDA